MTGLLTSQQAEELHKSILAYFISQNLSNTVAAFREELGLADIENEAANKKYDRLLEKKWTSVVRLQKKIMELETRNLALQKELDSITPSTSRKKKSPEEWLPSSPARWTLQSHRQPITCVAFHPIFSSLASGSEDTTIKIWDWELGELERTIKGHTKAVLDVDFGGPRGGVLLASCSSDLTIKLWDSNEDYKNIRTLASHDHSVSAVRFIPSGVAGAPWSGNVLASASRDKSVRIWDVTTGYCLKTFYGHSEWIRDLAPSFDGRWLVSGGNDQTLRLWDVESGEVRTTFTGHEHVVECVAIAPPNSYVHLSALAGLTRPPPLTASAEFVASGSRDKTIRIWEGRGRLLKTLVGHDNWVRGLVFHPGGRYLISVSDDKTIRCWDLTQDCKLVKMIGDCHGHFVSCVRWAPSLITHDGACARLDSDKSGGTLTTTAGEATRSNPYVNGITRGRPRSSDQGAHSLQSPDGTVVGKESRRESEETGEGALLQPSTMSYSSGPFRGSKQQQRPGTSSTSLSLSDGLMTKIRCVLVTGSVDLCVRVFAS